MAMETERHCPNCGEERTFWRVASTTVHLGEKVKWRCAECERGVVQIGDAVDTGVEA